MPQAISDSPTASSSSFTDKVKDGFSRINFRDGSKTVITIATLASLVAVVVVVMLWSADRNYSPLYGNQELFDASEIVSTLEAEGISYRLHNQTGQVMVAEDAIASARMLLASKGVQAKLPVGLDMLKDAASLGTSQFIETARYRHGLEGELARTIMTIDGVNSARVHLAIPPRTLMIRENAEQPSASVMLELKPGKMLDIEQVNGVLNLVKGSVSNLKANQISIVDQKGNLLTAELSDASGSNRASVHQIDFQRSLEQTYVRRISAMLQPLLGNKNFRVQVAADLNFDAIEETIESVDPNTVIKEELLNSDRLINPSAMGVPGSLSNNPPVVDGETTTQVGETANQNERSERQVRYASGTSIKHVKYEQGKVQQLSVSVLLNEAVLPADAWTPEQMANVRQMIQDSVGIKADRGDQLSLQAIKFTELADEEIEGMMSWWESPVILTYLRYIIGIAISLILIFFVLRPLVNHLIGNKKGADDDMLDGAYGSDSLLPSPDDMAAMLPASATGASSLVIASPQMMDSGDLQDDIDALLAQVQAPAMADLPDMDSPIDEQLSHLKMLAEKDPHKVAEVIQIWMSR